MEKGKTPAAAAASRRGRIDTPAGSQKQIIMALCVRARAGRKNVAVSARFELQEDQQHSWWEETGYDL